MYNFIETYKIDNINLCDDLIKYWKINKEYKFEGKVQGSSESITDKMTKDSIDVCFFNPSENKTIKSFFKQLSNKVQEYTTKYGMVSRVQTSPQNLIQCYNKGKGYPKLHYERCNAQLVARQLVYMLYLNTVTDKGGTEFPYQHIITPAIKGNLIIWPAEFTHPHRGVISPTQKKCIVTGWFELK